MALTLWCVVLVMWSTSARALYDGKTEEFQNILQLQAFAERLEALESLVARQHIVIEVLTENLAQQTSVTADLSLDKQEQDKEIVSLKNLLQHCECLPETFLPKPAFVTSRVISENDFQEHVSYDIENKEAVVMKENEVSEVFTSNDSPLNNIDTATADRDVARRSDDASALEAVVTQLSQQVQALSASSTQQEANLRDARSSTYVRWGHQDCPAGDEGLSASHFRLVAVIDKDGTSQRVYSGVMGGGYYDEPGSGVNNLCLTLSPVFGQPRNYYSYLYGTELETHDDIHHDKDPVCAVCRASFSTTIMIPGTNVCTAGWIMQYSGYLMGGHNTDPSGSEFICVDSAMETRLGGDANTQGKLLFYTSTRCGTLPCGPYINDRTVLCAVCSK